jgi:ABC-type transporter Mla subunit MlaD
VGDVLRQHPAEFDATLQNLVPLATNLGDILNDRETDLADLAGQGRGVLDQVAKRAENLPALVSALNGFLGVWVADLTVGPNWRILVTTAPASGHAYAPGTQPQPAPRDAALARIAGASTSAQDLAGILLAPVETPDLQRMPVARSLLRPHETAPRR